MSDQFFFFYKIDQIKGKGNLEHKATKYNPWNTRMLLHAHSTLETSFQYHTNSYPCFTKNKHMDPNLSIYFTPRSRREMQRSV